MATHPANRVAAELDCGKATDRTVQTYLSIPIVTEYPPSIVCVLFCAANHSGGVPRKIQYDPSEYDNLHKYLILSSTLPLADSSEKRLATRFPSASIMRKLCQSSNMLARETLATLLSNFTRNRPLLTI